MGRHKLIFLSIVLSLISFPVIFLFSQSEEPEKISPVVSTTPTEERDADDPAIWVDSGNPARSLIIGTDKDYGIEVWNLSGELIQKLPQGTKINNVDLRYDFKLDGKNVDIVVANLRKEGKLAVFIVNPKYTKDDALRQIAGKDSAGNDISKDSYGLGLYRRPADGSIYVFDIGKKKRSKLRQYLIEDDGSGNGVKVTHVRDLNYSGGTAEGMVADDELGFLYVEEEDKCTHKYYADPDKSSNEVSSFAYDDGIEGDREGIAIYKCKDGTGYIILSSQGNSTIKIYERQGNNRFIKTLNPVNDEGYDEMDTDGVDVASVSIPPLFPYGFLVLHGSPNSRFHIYDWRDVMGAGVGNCER